MTGVQTCALPIYEITWSRIIAKKTLDVVNARALAASGGSRMLISELKAQSDVLKSSGLTPTSAPGVYRELAQGDVDSLRLYGIRQDEIKGVKKEDPTPSSKSESKPQQKPDISKIKGAPSGSTIGNMVEGKGYEVKDSSGNLIGYAK